jgi:tetratricopeptide (TPR) repeat protein
VPSKNNLRVGNIKLKYGSVRYLEFENAVNLINTLLKDNLELDDCLVKLKAITFYEEASLIEEYIQLLSVASQSNKIRAMEYVKKLGKEHSIVEDFDKKLQDVVFRTELLYESFNKQFESMGDSQRSFIEEVLIAVKEDIERSIVNSEYTVAREQVSALKQLSFDHHLGGRFGKYIDVKTRQINDSLFDAYVGVARKAISRKVFSITERYLDAIYADRNFQDAIESGKLEALESELFEVYLREGDSYVESGDFEKAESFYGKAENSDFAKYNKGARKNLERSLQDLYYKKSNVSDSYVDVSGQKDVNTNDEGSNEGIIEELLVEYERYLSKAMIKKEASDFIACGRILDEAVELERKIRQVGYVETRASELLSSLNNPATYQKRLIRVNDYLDKKEYENAIKEYVKAGELYYQARLTVYGLYYVKLFDFVDLKRLDGLYVAYAQYALKTSDLDSAFKVYRKIEDRGIVFPGNDRFQEILGARISIRDQKKYPGANPKRILRDYLEGSDGMNEFKSAYLMMWKVS